jgi:adenine phosphoribosyltransferase
MLLEAVYRNAPAVRSGRHYTTINEFTDQSPALRPEVLLEARDRLCALGKFAADKILVEEDKGAILGAAVALHKGLPLAVARWYTYDLTDSITVPVDSGYFAGKLYVNGVSPGDRIVIVGDTISSGGTLAALIRAVEQAGAEVVEVLVVVEKVATGGAQRKHNEFGLPVRSVIRIEVNTDVCRTRIVGE